MNKTAIIEFIIDYLILKLWNVSNNMRKRLKWILKNKKISLVKYDARALIFNGHVKITKYDCPIQESIKKGVDNYVIRCQKQAEELISLNKELRCYSIPPLSVKQVSFLSYLSIEKDKFLSYSEMSFQKINYLRFEKCSTKAIQSFLLRVELINRISFFDCNLAEIDLKSKKIKNVSMQHCNFIGKVVLPPHLDSIKLGENKNTENLISFRITHFHGTWSNDLTKSEIIFLSQIKGLKEISSVFSIKGLFEALPSSLRKIHYFFLDNFDFDLVKAKLPYLRQIKNRISVEVAEKLNLRVFTPGLQGFTDKIDYRPRGIIVDTEAVTELNKRPELFEKAEFVEVLSKKFDFNCLAAGTKRIIITKIDFESIYLS